MDKVDLRPLFPIVRDQGIRGTCISFAVTAAHELARHGNTGKYEDLSEEALYWQCKQIDEDQQPGTSLNSASVALANIGQPHADTWPYDGFRDESHSAYVPPAEALNPICCFKAKLKLIQPTILEMKNCLANNQAIVLGILISDTFMMAPKGRVPMPSSHQLTDGHAILVVGFEEDETGEQWFIFRNSWGADWGDEGYGYLPAKYIETFGGEAVVVES